MVRQSNDDNDNDGFDSDQHGGNDCNDSEHQYLWRAIDTWYDGIDLGLLWKKWTTDGQ